MLRFLTAGESHGRALLAMIESFPAGCTISEGEINRHLARRQMGFGRGARMKIEKDRAVILSGIRHGQTLGSPISIMIDNRDWPNWERVMAPFGPLPIDLTPAEKRLVQGKSSPRPGHGDLAGAVKYHTHDLRNVLERG
jgi:chorismate synthase